MAAIRGYTFSSFDETGPSLGVVYDFVLTAVK
jgi:hypothetical protein